MVEAVSTSKSKDAQFIPQFFSDIDEVEVWVVDGSFCSQFKCVVYSACPFVVVALSSAMNLSFRSDIWFKSTEMSFSVSLSN